MNRALARLSVDSFWLVLGRVATQAGLALFTILLARGLGTEGFGEYAFLASVMFIGNVVTSFGTDMLLIREIAAKHDLSGLGPALSVQLLLSLAFIGLVFLGTTWLPSADPALTTALRVSSLTMLPLALYTVLTAALRGRQKMKAYAALSLASTLLPLGAALWLLIAGGGLVLLALLLLAAQVGAAMLSAIVFFADLPHAAAWLKPSLRKVPPMLRTSAPFALLGVLGVLYQRLNILLLPTLAGTATTGWYAAAAKVVEAAKIGHIAILTALYPMMAQQHSMPSTDAPRDFRIPGLVLLGGAALGAIAINLLASILMPLLFGPAYLPAVGLVRILAWMLIPYSLNSLLSLSLLARGQEKSVVIALLAGIGVLGLLSSWWTGTSGANGAAWAALCADCVEAALLVGMDLRGAGILRGMLHAEHPA